MNSFSNVMLLLCHTQTIWGGKWRIMGNVEVANATNFTCTNQRSSAMDNEPNCSSLRGWRCVGANTGFAQPVFARTPYHRPGRLNYSTHKQIKLKTCLNILSSFHMHDIDSMQWSQLFAWHVWYGNGPRCWAQPVDQIHIPNIPACRYVGVLHVSKKY